MVSRLCDSGHGSIAGQARRPQGLGYVPCFLSERRIAGVGKRRPDGSRLEYRRQDKASPSPGPFERSLGRGFLEDGKTLVSGGKDGCVRFWDVSAPPLLLARHKAFPLLAFTTDSQQFIAAGQPDGSVSVWDAVSLLPIESLPALGSDNSSVALSPDGRWLAIGDVAGNVKIWDWPARRAVTNLMYPAKTVGHLGLLSWREISLGGRLASGNIVAYGRGRREP